jgi:hypothetical protein
MDLEKQDSAMQFGNKQIIDMNDDLEFYKKNGFLFLIDFFYKRGCQKGFG